MDTWCISSQLFGHLLCSLMERRAELDHLGLELLHGGNTELRQPRLELLHGGNAELRQLRLELLHGGNAELRQLRLELLHGGNAELRQRRLELLHGGNAELRQLRMERDLLGPARSPPPSNLSGCAGVAQSGLSHEFADLALALVAHRPSLSGGEPTSTPPSV